LVEPGLGEVQKRQIQDRFDFIRQAEKHLPKADALDRPFALKWCLPRIKTYAGI
jgi:hypothetical protein